MSVTEGHGFDLRRRGVGGGYLSELGLTRPLAFALLLVVTLAIQSTLLTRVTLLGVTPQLLFVVVICLAYLEGEVVAVVIGFAGGLLQDFLLPESILGLTALVYTMVAYSVGSLRQFVSRDSVWMPVFAVAAASILAEGGYALLAILMGEPWVSVSETAKIGGLVALYNTLLTPFMFPLVRRIAERVRPERVVRI